MTKKPTGYGRRCYASGRTFEIRDILSYVKLGFWYGRNDLLGQGDCRG